MTIVIDASVAVKWVLAESGSDQADSLLDQEQLIAPVLWLAEAANALWRNVRIGQLSADQAGYRLSELLNAPVASLAIEPYIESALRLAHLSLALHHDTHVVTADRRFAAAASGPDLAGRVRLLGS